MILRAIELGIVLGRCDTNNAKAYSQSETDVRSHYEQ